MKIILKLPQCIIDYSSIILYSTKTVKSSNSIIYTIEKKEGDTLNIIKPFEERYALSREAIGNNVGLLYYVHLYVI